MSSIVEDIEMTETKSPPKIETFDDILKHVGDAGWYQLIIFIMLVPAAFIYSFLYFSQLFLTLVSDKHWCNVPELNNTVYNFTDAQKLVLSIPRVTTAELQEVDDFPFSRCLMYAVNFTEVLASGVTEPDSSWPTKPCDHGWTFDRSIVPYASIAAELGWVCDQTYLATLTQSTFFIGSIIGGLIYGYIADHYGRISALVACNIVGFLASVATAFCNSFWSFTLVRIVTGMTFDNCFNILFIINVEYIGPRWRTLTLNLSMGLFFGFGMCISPWLAYWIADWRTFSWVIALPMTVAFVSPWIVPESARWYISIDKMDKAIEMLKKFARINGKEVQPEIYEEFKKRCKIIKDNEIKFGKHTLFDIFKKPRLARITLILILCWLMSTVTMNSNVWDMELLAPNVFVSYSLAASTELLAGLILILTLDKVGRRLMGFLSMTFAGIFSLMAIITPQGMITVIMAIMSRLCLNAVSNLGMQWAAELLPTVVRAQGVSLIHIVGFMGYFAGPYVVYLGLYGKALPLIVIALLSFFGAIFCLMLPETLGQKLPEILQDGNDFGREQNFWWIPCVAASNATKKKISN